MSEKNIELLQGVLESLVAAVLVRQGVLQGQSKDEITSAVKAVYDSLIGADAFSMSYPGDGAIAREIDKAIAQQERELDEISDKFKLKDRITVESMQQVSSDILHMTSPCPSLDDDRKKEYAKRCAQRASLRVMQDVVMNMKVVVASKGVLFAMKEYATVLERQSEFVRSMLSEASSSAAAQSSTPRWMLEATKEHLDVTKSMFSAVRNLVSEIGDNIECEPFKDWVTEKKLAQRSEQLQDSQSEGSGQENGAAS